ncbi:MAG TPA: ABC transporter permease, partial [Sphingomicrobium sp.]|nr:ABC transporter permease [Sphingomicrobium sp.]
MNLSFKLALRDLRGGLSGLGLLWLCLAVAIAGLASVTSLASSVDRAIADNGRQLLGGDLMLTVSQREASDEEKAAVDALGPSSKSITTRAMLVAASGRSILSELSGVDSAWPLAGKLDLAAGGKRPQGAEIAIGREIAERLDLRAGDRLRVGRASYRISGVINKAPGASGFALAPPSVMDEAGLASSGLIQPGSISTTSYRILLPPDADGEAAGKAFQRRFAEGGWRSTSRDEAG